MATLDAESELVYAGTPEITEERPRLGARRDQPVARESSSDDKQRLTGVRVFPHRTAAFAGRQVWGGRIA
jgi:hypothetical protein